MKRSYIITELICITMLIIFFGSQSVALQHNNSLQTNLLQIIDFSNMVYAVTLLDNCVDQQQTNQQYNNSSLTKRQQIEKIVLTDIAIQKIINGNTCEFMSDSTLYTENGTYQVLNINLNNTQMLIAKVSLQNNSVVSYELHPLTRTYLSFQISPFDYVLPYLYGVGATGIIVALILIWKTKKRKKNSSNGAGKNNNSVK